MKQILAGLALTAALVLLANGPVAAIVGATTPGDVLASGVVMVLNRTAAGAGLCSGIVVAQNAILTAAHCLAAPKDMRVHFLDEAGAPILMEVARPPRIRYFAPTRRRPASARSISRCCGPPSRFPAASTP